VQEATVPVHRQAHLEADGIGPAVQPLAFVGAPGQWAGWPASAATASAEVTRTPGIATESSAQATGTPASGAGVRGLLQPAANIAASKARRVG
jgi:hypothetical protein